jgi:hypothetical protein
LAHYFSVTNHPDSGTTMRRTSANVKKPLYTSH